MIKDSEVNYRNIKQYVAEKLGNKASAFRRFFLKKYNATLEDKPLTAMEWVIRLLNGQVEDTADKQTFKDLMEQGLV